MDDFDRVIKAFEEMKNSSVVEEDLLKKMGWDFTEAVKARTPVDTGLLRRSWKTDGLEKNGKTTTLKIINDALNKPKTHYYGRFVEFGHWTKKLKGTNKRNWVPGYFMKTRTEEEFKTRNYGGYFVKLLKGLLFHDKGNNKGDQQ